MMVKKRALSLLLLLSLLLSLSSCRQLTSWILTTESPGTDASRAEVSLGYDMASPDRYSVVIDSEDPHVAEIASQLARSMGTNDVIYAPTYMGELPHYRVELLVKERPEDAHPMDHTITIDRENKAFVIISYCSAGLEQAANTFFSRIAEHNRSHYYREQDETSYSFFSDHADSYCLFAYEFLSSAPGFGGGRVRLSSPVDQTLTFYWGDERGPLNGYSYLLQAEVKADRYEELQIQSFTAIPQGATCLLAVDEKGNIPYVYDLPAHRRMTGEALYSFGAISDSHMGTRYGSASIPYDHFVNAVRILDQKGCSLVSICGDISYDNILSEYQLHEKAVKECYTFAPHLPIYTVSGNHESKYTGFSREWFLQYSRNVVDYRTDLLPQFTDGNDLDFVIELPDGSVMIYLNQVYYDYGKQSSRLLTDAQLDWLESRLAAYDDRTVFLFFHTFLDEEVGDGTSSGGGEYSLPLIEGTVDHRRLTALLQVYKNVVYFSGHSHQSFDTMFLSPKPGKTNYDVNIDNKDGSFATMVHIPSVAAPRVLSQHDSSQTNATDRSEGYIVHVYADCILLEGYDFVNQKSLSYANYIIPKQ